MVYLSHIIEQLASYTAVPASHIPHFYSTVSYF